MTFLPLGLLLGDVLEGKVNGRKPPKEGSGVNQKEYRIQQKRSKNVIFRMWDESWTKKNLIAIEKKY